MGDNGDSTAGSVLNDDFGGLAESTASIGHVVNNDGDLAANITDQDHARDLIGTGALLVDEGKAEVEAVGDGGSSLCTASIGGHNHTVLDLKVVADPAEGAGFSVEVVDGDIEEALDLRGVEIHRDDMVAASGLKHVSHQTGSDGRTRFILLVLTSVGEVGQDGGDAAGRGRLASVDHDEQFHDSIVDVARGGGLQHKDCCDAKQSVLCHCGFERPRCVIPSSSRTDSPMLMLDSLFEYCRTMILASSIPRLWQTSCQWALRSVVGRCACGDGYGQKFFVCAQRAGCND